MKKFLSILVFVSLFVSCQKDDEKATGPDLFVGSYSGSSTTMLVANGDFLEYIVTPITKTIEKGSEANELVVGKGTDMEFNASVDGRQFVIPGQIMHYFVKKSGVDLSFSLTGQGIWSNNELTITYGSYVKIDNVEYKLTIVESLTRNAD